MFKGICCFDFLSLKLKDETARVSRIGEIRGSREGCLRKMGRENPRMKPRSAVKELQ